MNPKNKSKHISKLKYVKIGDIPKKSNIESNDFKDSLVIEAQDDSYETHQESEKSDKVEDSSNFVFQKKFQDKAEVTEPKANKFLPSFLHKILPSKKESKPENLETALPSSNLKLLPFSPSTEDSQQNPNSFSSIFNREHEEVYGIQRVFRKSSMFLIFQLVSFALLSFSSSSFFTLPLIWTIFVGIAYIVITNLFFIVVADRSYVWISLLGHAIITLITQAFVGLSFDRITLIFILLIVIFVYFAYAELEKVQLSSRLFSIAHITTEATRVMTTVLILVFCLGIFNKAVYQGNETFIKEAFLDKPLIMDNLIIGRYANASLNRALMKGRFSLENGVVKTNVARGSNTIKVNALFSDFLTQNYRPGDTLLSEVERTDFLANCNSKTGTKVCDTQIEEEKSKRLEAWRIEAYGNLPYTLNTELTAPVFKEVTKQFYIDQIRAFNSNKDNRDSSSDLINSISGLLIIQRSYILPALIVLMIFLILSLLKPVLNWLVFIATLGAWNLLKLTGFTKIEVENVEAEIVSI